MEERTEEFSDYGRVLKRKVNYYEFAVPFSGEGDLSHVRPSQFTLNSPQGAVHEDERTAYCAQGSEDGRSVRQAVERDFATIVGFTDVAGASRDADFTFDVSDFRSLRRGRSRDRFLIAALRRSGEFRFQARTRAGNVTARGGICVNNQDI